jgi:CRISPR type III-A-associated protein Csm2
MNDQEARLTPQETAEAATGAAEAAAEARTAAAETAPPEPPPAAAAAETPAEPAEAAPEPAAPAEAKPSEEAAQPARAQGRPAQEARPPRGPRQQQEKGQRKGQPERNERNDRGERKGPPRDAGRQERRGAEGPVEIDLEKLIADSLYLDNQAHAIVARMRDMDSGTRSQLRRLFSAVRRACRTEEAERQHAFVMLRARLAYTIARHQLRSLDPLEKLLLQVTRKNDARGYERFRDLFEAIVAYNE